MYQEFYKKYPYLCEINKFNENTMIREEEIEACKLIHPCRLDFMAKLLYLDGMDKDGAINPGKDIYEKHLIAFSDGRMKEKGQEDKQGLQKYIDTFHSLWESVSQNEGDVLSSWPSVPVDCHYFPIDGAHRISCAIKAQKKLKIYCIDFEAPEYCQYNFLYWRKKYLDEQDILEMVKKYCSVRRTSLILSSESDDRLWKRIYQEYNPIYMNRIKGQTMFVLDMEFLQMNDLKKETMEKEMVLTNTDEILNFLVDYQKNLKENLGTSLKKRIGRSYHWIRSYFWDVKDRMKKIYHRG